MKSRAFAASQRRVRPLAKETVKRRLYNVPRGADKSAPFSNLSARRDEGIRCAFAGHAGVAPATVSGEPLSDGSLMLSKHREGQKAVTREPGDLPRQITSLGGVPWWSHAHRQLFSCLRTRTRPLGLSVRILAEIAMLSLFPARSVIRVPPKAKA